MSGHGAASGPGLRRGPMGGTPGMGLAMPVERAQDFRRSLRRMLARLRPERWLIALVLGLATVSVVFAVLGPKLLGNATNIVFAGVVGQRLPAGLTQQQAADALRAAGHDLQADLLSGMSVTPGAGIDFSALTRTLLVVAGVYLLSSLFSWAQNYLMAGVTQRTMYRLREEVDVKLGRLPLSYFDRHPRGDLLSRVTNDIDNITMTLQQTMTQLITSVMTVVGVLAMMFWISPLLAGVSLLMVPLSFVVTMLIARRSQPHFVAQWKWTGQLNGHVEEMYTGHELVKVFGHRAQAVAEFDTANDAMYEASFRAQFISGVIQPAMMFLSNLNYVAIAVIGGVQVARGAISLGDVQAFIQYSRQFTMPITQIASVTNLLQSGLASAERVFELLDADEQAPDHQPATPLRDVAGKTTLVNLLMRFYDVDSGRILVDGVDAQRATRDELRSAFGMVLQDTWLFAGTIRDNIAYGRLDATEAEILAAAAAAHVDHFVRTLPDGYDTVLDDEASNVSAGERQLLTIARAFLADPRVLILDEATSSVDTRTEILIQQAMAALRHGRTSFVIAHRLSTIRDADVILVMDRGAIVEQGTHDELLARDGRYAELFRSQFTGAGEQVA